MELQTKIEELPKVGDVTQEKLHNLGIFTVVNLLQHFPTSYRDYSQITPIKNISVGSEVTIVAKVLGVSSRRSFQRRLSIQEGIISDETGTLKVLWFNQPYISKTLQTGEVYRFSGRVEQKRGLQLTAPVYEPFSKEAVHTARLVPEYALTEGISHKLLRYWIHYVFRNIDTKNIPDTLPENIREKEKLLKLHEALEKIHFPSTQKDIDLARKRIAFDELFLLQLHSAGIQRKFARLKAQSIPFIPKQTQEIVSSLPFTLTADQKRATFEILKDLEAKHPMNRLLEGDVGSGKTVCALIAAHSVVSAGSQVAIVAPTEILAQQHFETAKKVFAQFDVRVTLITSKSRVTWHGISKEISKANKDTTKTSHLVIGTHAVFEDAIIFQNLGLIVIDEQQRFGVLQRSFLQKKYGGHTPHFLSMTATPIPRSLALVLIGELQISLIRTKPKGRKKIGTFLVPPAKREDAYGFIKKELSKGHQAYVVFPLIEPSEKLQAKALLSEHKKLQEITFPEFRVGYIHGRMKKEEKDSVMNQFRKGEIDILLSTSVIEVGVDVPNATIMMVESAERFGLAQLHQLRGRVGRSDKKSYCLLFSGSSSENSLARLKTLEKLDDGFALAEADLKFRGPGQVYGTLQSGYLEQLKIASLDDRLLVNAAKKHAQELVEEDPRLKHHPEIKKQLEVFETKVHLE